MSGYERYEGGFKRGKMHGRGVLFFRKGDVYEGYWHRGKMTGCVTYFDLRGRVHFFRWVEGELEVRERDDEADKSFLFAEGDGETHVRLRKDSVLGPVRSNFGARDKLCCCCGRKNRT